MINWINDNYKWKILINDQVSGLIIEILKWMNKNGSMSRICEHPSIIHKRKRQ
jgi:hypothetical protein